MLFNSLAFLFFFASVYLLYLLLGRFYRAQNILLLAASYTFYGYWDWRFCFLLGATTLIQFMAGRLIGSSEDPRKRKAILAVAVTCSLVTLGIFKYFNFFADNLEAVLRVFGMDVTHSTLHLVLPVGMSFYTFKEISYVADIYRRKLQPAKNILDFALYVSFFPQLVAGPIERAGEMLPQIQRPRKITSQYIDVGIYLVTWGFFKKVVVADNLAEISAQVFNNYRDYNGLDILLGILAYTFQIYCDFSGYTDIARGLAKLLGFDLPLNFRLPYLARSPSDFWNRWHVTLSQWLRDYLYISLGGNRVPEWKVNRNLMITMVLGGLWHGAAWNFVAWGAYHGLILVIYRAIEKRRPTPAVQGSWRVAGSVAFMFVLTMIGWVCFNSKSLEQIVYMLTHVGFSTSSETVGFAGKLVFFVAPLAIVQGVQAYSGNLLELMRMRTVGRWALQTALLLAIVLFGARQSTEFIYFQF